MLNSSSDNVCELKKSLHGLRQPGLRWHKKLVEKLTEINFRALPQDPCMFMSEKENSIMYIAIYVDDILCATNDYEWLSKIKASLSRSFETKDLGEINKCLGIEFSRHAYILDKDTTSSRY